MTQKREQMLGEILNLYGATHEVTQTFYNACKDAPDTVKSNIELKLLFEIAKKAKQFESK